MVEQENLCNQGLYPWDLLHLPLVNGMEKLVGCVEHVQNQALNPCQIPLCLGSLGDMSWEQGGER